MVERQQRQVIKQESFSQTISEIISSPTLETALGLDEFSQSILKFPELQAVGVTLNRDPSFPPILTFILVTPLSPSDPETAMHWDELAEARAKYRKTSGNSYFVSLHRIDPEGRDLDGLLEEASQKWKKEKHTEVILVAKTQMTS